MRYYKIQKNDVIVGVGTTQDFRMYQLKHQIILFTKPDNVQFIQIGDLYYRDSVWMLPLSQEIPVELIEASVVEISEEEYNAYSSALEVQETIQPQIEEKKEPIKEDVTDADLEFVSDMKIKELSAECKKAIEDGLDINGKHYSFTVEDQLELQSIQPWVATGEKKLYHADGEPYREYNLGDLFEIYDKLQKNKEYHRVYFNKLKHYVMTLQTVADIGAIYYGIEIPE